MTDKRPPALAPRRDAVRDVPTWERVEKAVPPRQPVSTRMVDRLAERKRRERRRRLVAFARLLVAAALVLGAGWAVAASPLLAVRAEAIEWVGLTPEIDAVGAATVVEAAEGASLVMVDLDALESQLALVAGVREATIERVWPHGLRVTLTPRRPVAAVPDPAGYVLLDAYAIAVGTVTAPPAGIPVVEVPVGDERVLAAVLEVIRALPADVLVSVGSIAAPTEDSISFTLADGPRVDWGSAEDSALKAQVLEAMLASGAASGVAVVDVSAPTLPITSTTG